MTESELSSSNPVGEAVTAVNILTEDQLKEFTRLLSAGAKSNLNGLLRGRAGRIKGGTFLLVAVALIAGLLGGVYKKKAVASGERATPQADWGYTVSQYSFRNRMRLDLWADSSTFSSSSDATLDLSNVSIDRITEERWLADGKAIYLNMLVRVDGKQHPAKVVYDFQRGEMHTWSPVDLWRLPDEPGKPPKMTEAEFQSVLERYTAGVQPAASAAPSAAPSASVSAAPPSPTASLAPSPSATAAPVPEAKEPAK